MKLSDAPVGEYTVGRVLVGGGPDREERGERILRRLQTLGIRPGAPITLDRIGAGDVRVISVRGMRLALGRQIASQITVTPR